MGKHHLIFLHISFTILLFYFYLFSSSHFLHLVPFKTNSFLILINNIFVLFSLPVAEDKPRKHRHHNSDPNLPTAYEPVIDKSENSSDQDEQELGEKNDWIDKTRVSLGPR